MDENEIQQLIKLIQESKMPDWWTEYVKQIAYNLQVHTKGLMFDKITGLYPNENPDSRNHCVNSFEPITKGSIWKAINNIIRVFNNSSWSIQISEQTQKLIEEYTENEGSLFSQFLETWIRYAIATDPNGICVTYPPDYTGDLYRYVCYRDIVHIDSEVLIFISEDESDKKYEYKDHEYQKEVFYDYDHPYEEGHPNVRYHVVRTYNRRMEVDYKKKVFHVFTKTHFVRFEETEGAIEFEYEWIKFKKELDTLPYFYNGGVEVEKNIYESFVQPFVPFGNLALMSHRNHRAVDLMFSYPRMSELQQPCDTCQSSGYVACETGKEVCKVCKGSKYVTVQSPYKIYRKTHDSFDADGRVLSTPSVEFYSPDAAILGYSKQEWKDYLEQAEEAVFVVQRQDTGQVQAAKSKQLDMEGLYAWLANIAKVFFSNLQMFLQYLENYVNTNPIEVSVEKPYSFAILTEEEAFEALKAILNSTAPVMVKSSRIDNFIQKFISESSPVKRALQILKKYDLLLYYSNVEVNEMKGNGFVDLKLCQIHSLAYPVLIQMYEMNKELFEQTDEQIIKKLETELKKYEMTSTMKEKLMLNGEIDA